MIFGEAAQSHGKQSSAFPLLGLFSVLVGWALLLSSCSTPHENSPREPSQAFQNHQSTFQGRLFQEEVKKHPGESGFSLIPYGHNAFKARMAMIRLAEKSLDLQYYIWTPDTTGHLLTNELLKAADRGVRVRVLVDDLGLKGRDKIIAKLDAHPNMQIRVFNPFVYRNSRGVNFLTDFGRLNHRMHNKVIVADNAVAIIGGRNIGDHYFSISKEGNFRDLDVICAGPVVRDISRVHDYFWNAKWAVPIKTVFKNDYTEKHLKKSRARLQKRIRKNPFPYPLEMSHSGLAADMMGERARMIWAYGIYVWNDPKELQRSRDQQQGTIIRKLAKKMARLNGAMHVNSPYFVPGDSGVAELKVLVDRGVDVRILTNSLHSNDVILSHAGYAEYRKELLEAGVQLYELRPDAREGERKSKISFSGTKGAGLHTKAFVFDRASVFIGSFNLDPRSAQINSEGGLYVESKALARELTNYMNVDFAPRNSYRVDVDSDGKLIWTTEKGGKPIMYHREPGSSAWSNFKVRLIQWLPIEGQL